MLCSQQSDRRSSFIGGSASALMPSSLDRSEMHGIVEYAPLPEAFGGAKGLVMPHYLQHRSSGVTLPSRLGSLGSTEFVSIAAMSALDVGNSVVVRIRIWYASCRLIDSLTAFAHDALLVFQARRAIPSLLSA
jgi:hypothetical protein